jgi:hypothetical protein
MASLETHAWSQFYDNTLKLALEASFRVATLKLASRASFRLQIFQIGTLSYQMATLACTSSRGLDPRMV